MLYFSLEFHLLFRSSPSPTFSFVFPDRLPYQHIALLRQLFISTSMAMSQFGPLLFPETPSPFAASSSALSEDERYTRAVADLDGLKPLIERLMRMTAQAELEASALQSLELRPLLESVKPDPDAPGAEETKVIRGLVDQIVASWEDSQLRSNSRTARAWEEALRRRSQQDTTEHVKAEDAEIDEVDGSAGAVKVEEQGETEDAFGAAPTSDSTGGGYDVASADEAEPATALPTAADDAPVSLDSAVIPPPVTLFVSPPASPRARDASAAGALPVLEVVLGDTRAGPVDPEVKAQNEADADEREGADPGVKKTSRLAAEQLDSRLPTPPPDE